MPHSEVSPARSLMLLRLVLLIVASLPVLLLVTASYFIWNDASRSAWVDLEWRSGIAAENVNRIFVADTLAFRQIDDLLGDMSDAEIEANQQKIHIRLQEIGRGISQLKTLYVCGSQGRLLASSLSYPVPDVSLADRDFFLAAQTASSDEPLAGRLRARKGDQQLAFGIVRRRDVNRKFAGIIGVSTALSDFERDFNEYLSSSSAGAAISLVRSDGQIMARIPPGDFPNGIPSSEFINIIRRGGGHLVGHSVIDGLLRWANVRKVGEYPIYVSASVPFRTVVQHWIDSVSPHLLFGIPAYITMIMMVTFCIRNMRQVLQEQSQRILAERAASESQRMEAVGRLAAGIAHDFNNALTVITGYTEIALSGNPDDRGLRNIQTAANNAAALVDRILSFSRDSPGHVVTVEANERIRQIADVLPPVLGGGIITLHVHYCAEPCYIEVDPVEMEMALLNICFNARDALPNGGTIVISLEKRDDKLAIVVGDDGIGMSPEVQARAFDPFFTTKPLGKGTGIGLPHVASFARNAGGSTELSSSLGKGTEVTVVLPLATAPTAPAPIEADALVQSQQRRILLIEDDAPVAEIIELLLRSVGYDVTYESRAQPALTRLQSERYDLVLSDIRMPGGKTGIDVAREMTTDHPDTPLILITGYAEDLARVGATRVLLKPVKRDVLVKAIYETMEKWPSAEPS